MVPTLLLAAGVGIAAWLAAQNEKTNSGGSVRPKLLGPRSARQAALDLAAFLTRTARYGSKTDKPAEVRAAQRDLGVAPDGIVGPITRDAAFKAGVQLPTKTTPARTLPVPREVVPTEQDAPLEDLQSDALRVPAEPESDDYGPLAPTKSKPSQRPGPSPDLPITMISDRQRGAGVPSMPALAANSAAADGGGDPFPHIDWDKGGEITTEPASQKQQDLLARSGHSLAELPIASPTAPSKPQLNTANKGPSVPTPAKSAKRSAKQAAEDLAKFLKLTKRFGSKTDKPAEIKAAQRDLGVAADGVVGPITRKAAAGQGVALPLPPANPTTVSQPAATKKPTVFKSVTPIKSTPTPKPAAAAKSVAAPKRSKQQAAKDLAVFLQRTGRYGSKTDKPNEIKTAQRDLGVAADGVVGPLTRKAAAAQGVTLPTKK